MLFSNFEPINTMICCQNLAETWALSQKMCQIRLLSNAIFRQNNQETVKLGS
jgi:hypothetical protein